jgi:CRP-like cAMP-binding protein
MYLVGDGTLDVSSKGRHIQTRGAGEYVGEVALLFDTPRTATIVAAAPTVLYRLDRDPFLEAITGHPRSTSRAESQARRRMSTVTIDDPPIDDDPTGG